MSLYLVLLLLPIDMMMAMMVVMLNDHCILISVTAVGLLYCIHFSFC